MRKVNEQTYEEALEMSEKRIILKSSVPPILLTPTILFPMCICVGATEVLVLTDQHQRNQEWEACRIVSTKKGMYNLFSTHMARNRCNK